MGDKPLNPTQNESRRYSEIFSQEVSEWFAGYLKGGLADYKFLEPEKPVRTRNGSKRLDIGILDRNSYLALDVSVKTFNFKDRKTNAYSKNFTGRCYELIAESLEIRTNYPYSILVALILLPEDGCEDYTDKRPSSFGNAVKTFSKLIQGKSLEKISFLCDYGFIGLFNESGEINFFDMNQPPPQKGKPLEIDLLDVHQISQILTKQVHERINIRSEASLPETIKFKWASSN